jgi:hypothetical protein
LDLAQVLAQCHVFNPRETIPADTRIDPDERTGTTPGIALLGDGLDHGRSLRTVPKQFFEQPGQRRNI